MNILNKIGISSLAAILLTAGSATAGTLTFYDSLDPPEGERFTIECSLGCAGWDGDSWIVADGDALVQGFAGNPDNEAAALNAILGSDVFTGADASKTNLEDLPLADPSDFDFTSSAEYIYFKAGTIAGIVWNTGGADNFFEYDQTGTGAGLSHYTEFGEVAPVPLPAGGLLLLTALGGGAFAARRKKSS